MRPERSPKAVDAARVDDVAFLGPDEHRQKGARVFIDTAPADIERAVPFVAAADDHAVAAADAGIVEEQMDLVGRVLRRDRVAKFFHLAAIRNIRLMRRDPQALRHARRIAEPLRFLHRRGRDIAHGDMTAFGCELADELAAHAGAAAGDDRNFPREIFHLSRLSIAPSRL